MFNEEEMQMLISGGGEGFNVADARSHVNYAGGYHPDHPVMQNFWKVGLQQNAFDCWHLLTSVAHAQPGQPGCL